MRDYENTYFDSEYPEYLIASYYVRITPYDQSKETQYLTDSAKRILKDNRFPKDGKIKFILIRIKNQAEHVSEATFQQSFKAGLVLSIEELTQAKDLDSLIRNQVVERDAAQLSEANPKILRRHREQILSGGQGEPQGTRKRGNSTGELDGYAASA